MNSIIRATSRMMLRSSMDRARLSKPFSAQNCLIQQRWAHNAALTYDFARERIMLNLRLFDKIDPEKLTLDSHFRDDLGLDSLDHVEIIVEIENDFLFEIPDKDAEKLVTPRHILTYITDHEEAYEELQRMQAGHHHHEYTLHLIDKPEHSDHHHENGHDNGHDGASHNHAHGQQATAINQQPARHFSTMAQVSRRFMSTDKYETSFYEKPKKDVNIDQIRERVMKICANYDKIDASKLDAASHFVQDLGLDSLDHVEIIMELEDEFGLEIPDKDAEKLMRPSQIAAYIFEKEESRSMTQEERPF